MCFMLMKVDRRLSSTEIVLTPSKLRTQPRRSPVIAQSSDDRMPLLKKESDQTPTPSSVSRTKFKPSDQAHGDDMPILEKEAEEDLAACGPADSSADSGWTSSVDKPPSLVHRSRRHLDSTDRRFGYDPREWRIPKLTIRRRRASGQSAAGNSGALVSSTSPMSGLIYEILPACGRGSVDSQPSSDDCSYSDHKSSTTSSSPESISPAFFYGGGTSGNPLKRLRLKFGEESVAIDVDQN